MELYRKNFQTNLMNSEIEMDFVDRTLDQPILEAKNVVKHFAHNDDSIIALDGIDLKIGHGDFVCLVGPSGCGKSTFLNIIAGLEKADSGEMLLDGRKISELDPNRIIVFQEGALFPWLNVIDNVEFGLKMSLVPKKERREISLRYLDMMQLTKFANSYAYQLSTGMKQRVAIARALVMDPAILLMDEPFAALDAQTRDLLLVELQLIWERTRKTILFVTHSIAESVILGNRVVVFKNRPSKIKKEIVINYRRPRLAEDENLLKYQQKIITELKSEIKDHMKDEFGH